MSITINERPPTFLLADSPRRWMISTASSDSIRPSLRWVTLLSTSVDSRHISKNPRSWQRKESLIKPVASSNRLGRAKAIRRPLSL